MIAIAARWFDSGGPFMWVILMVLGFACAVTIERLIFYFFICRRNSFRLVAGVIKALNGDNVEEAHRTAGNGRAPARSLIRTAVAAYADGLKGAEIIESVEEAAINEMPRIGQRLNYLSLCANIATLLGLLGTISGLQISFGSIASVEAAKKATMLAQGISVAMNTTAFGLIVAVPCMVAYTVFSNMQQQRVKDIDQSMVRLMNYFRKKRP
jgi:biopolymer transport protein ExbB